MCIKAAVYIHKRTDKHKKQENCALAIQAQYKVQYHKVQPTSMLIAEISMNALRVDY